MKKVCQYLTWKNFFSYLLPSLLLFMVYHKTSRVDTHLKSIAHSNNPFVLANIVNKLDHNPDWEVKMSQDRISFINVITQQPFRWLAKGFQAYAFESQDGEYVLKFFQQTRLAPRAFADKPVEYLFSKSYRDKLKFLQEHRREIFTSSKISFEDIPEETGILFVHLNKTTNLLRGIRLTDCLGQSYKIKPDQTSFLVQRKAQYVLPTIEKLMKSGETEMAEARIVQLFELLLSLAKKQIVDGDYALIRNNNIGFVKDRAIYIDTGHLAKVPNLDVKKQMRHEFDVRMKPLYDWLTVKYPELAQFYDMKKNELLQSLDQEVKTVA